MAKRKARRKKAGGKTVTFDMCKHMTEGHQVRLLTIEALALISAATHAVKNGYDDGTDVLEDAVNELLHSCGIDCEWEDDGTMILTVNPKGN